MSHNSLDWDPSIFTWERNQQPWQNTHNDAVAPSPSDVMYHYQDQSDARYTACGGQTAIVDNQFTKSPFSAKGCESIASPHLSSQETRSNASLLHYPHIAMNRDLSVDCGQVLFDSARSSHSNLSGSQHQTPSTQDSSSPSASNSHAEVPGSQRSTLLSLPTHGKVVSQRPYTYRGRSNQVGLQGESTKFSVWGQPGFMLKDAREKKYCGLDGRDDAMFFNDGSCISIRIELINCKSWSRQIKTLDWRKPRRPITKAKLATEIAKVMDTFFREMYHGVGSSDANTDRLTLTALNRVSKSSWQPELLILD